MKTLKTIMIFLICFGYALEAQDRTDPTSILPILNYPASLYNFNQTEIVRGWNWGCPCRTLDEAMCINAYHGFPFDAEDVARDIYVVGVANDSRTILN